MNIPTLHYVSGKCWMVIPEASQIVGLAWPTDAKPPTGVDGIHAAPTSRGSSTPSQSSSASTYGPPVPTAASWSVLQLSWRWHAPHADRPPPPAPPVQLRPRAPQAKAIQRSTLSLAMRSYFPAPFNLMTSSSTKRKSAACNYTVTFNPLSGLDGSDSQELQF